MEKETLVVNLYGGPGTGKSTICAQLFSMLKWRGTNCEMALEFAKDKVWEESFKVLDNQIYIFGKQLHKIHRLNGKVDCIITDAPILMSLIYDESGSKPFKDLVLEQHKKMNTVDFFLKRHKPFNPAGRVQGEDKAKSLDTKISMMLMDNAIPHHKIDALEENVHEIYDEIITHLYPTEYINAVRNA